MTSVLYYLLFALYLDRLTDSFPVLYRISDVLYFFIYYTGWLSERKPYFNNLRTSFPEKSDRRSPNWPRLFTGISAISWSKQ